MSSANVNVYACLCTIIFNKTTCAHTYMRKLVDTQLLSQLEHGANWFLALTEVFVGFVGGTG